VGAVNTGPVSANPLEAFGGAGSNVGAANQTGVNPFITPSEVLDAQSKITPQGPAQPKAESDIIDAVFTDIAANPNVQTTAPQLSAPNAGVASGVLSGTPITAPTTQTTPALLAPPNMGTLPAFDISSVSQPNVTTNLEQITIPGTDVTVDVPKLAAPTTDTAVNTQMPTGLAALGTGGTFNPNLAAGSTVSAAPITATEAVATEQSIIDKIGQEVAETGALSSGTALALSRTTNLSMQEIVNIAENAMGIEASVATGPSTSLTSTANTSLAPVGGPGTFDVSTNTANTGIASLDTSSEVGGLTGEVLDAQNSVVTTNQTPAVDNTIEGTTNSMDVDVPLNTDVAVEVEVPVDTSQTINMPPNKPTVIAPPVVAAPVVETPVTVDPPVAPPVVVETPVDTTVLGPTTVVEDDDDDIFVEVDEVDDDDDIIVDDNDDDPEDVIVDLDTDDDDVDDEVVEEAPFECPEGFEAKKINGQWRCQAEEEGAQRVRPTGGAYYQPNLNPEYGSRRRA
jgi:hypothetical protein